MNKATIYGKEDCVWCNMAEALCKEKNVEYTVLKLGVDYEIEDFTSHFPYAKTVPQIYFNEKHIGGYESLTKIFIKD